MKTLPFLAAVLLACVSALAESPSGFADIPFGSPVALAQKTLSAREGLKAETSASDRLTFTGGTFAGQPVSKWDLTFVGDKLAKGSVLIEKVKKPVYDDLKAQLTKKYGKPDSEKGHHSWETMWVFRSHGNRTVRLNYEFEGRVVLTYANEAIAKSAPPGKKSDL